ncbi:hypothetical protein [Streptomyces plumbiresistens]|uniref:hypothetical protein n=1 Tax=Streptomyces plumbiresistens TaxID=511811 RepID=UPI003CD0AD1B
MGSGIAEVCARAGLDVVVRETGHRAAALSTLSRSARRPAADSMTTPAKRYRSEHHRPRQAGSRHQSGTHLVPRRPHPGPRRLGPGAGRESVSPELYISPGISGVPSSTWRACTWTLFPRS